MGRTWLFDFTRDILLDVIYSQCLPPGLCLFFNLIYLSCLFVMKASLTKLTGSKVALWWRNFMTSSWPRSNHSWRDRWGGRGSASVLWPITMCCSVKKIQIKRRTIMNMLLSFSFMIFYNVFISILSKRYNIFKITVNFLTSSSLRFCPCKVVFQIIWWLDSDDFLSLSPQNGRNLQDFDCQVSSAPTHHNIFTPSLCLVSL